MQKINLDKYKPIKCPYCNDIMKPRIVLTSQGEAVRYACVGECNTLWRPEEINHIPAQL